MYVSTYPVQWAADKTVFTFKIDPPQVKPPDQIIAAMYGNSSIVASLPPTMRPSLSTSSDGSWKISGTRGACGKAIEE